jgi:hypothetical protein
LNGYEKIFKIFEKSSGHLRQPAVMVKLALMVSAKHRVRQEAETFQSNLCALYFHKEKNSKVIV